MSHRDATSKETVSVESVRIKSVKIQIIFVVHDSISFLFSHFLDVTIFGVVSFDFLFSFIFFFAVHVGALQRSQKNAASMAVSLVFVKRKQWYSISINNQHKHN